MTESWPWITPSRSPRRVVTGHDAEGRSIIASDGDFPVNIAYLHQDMVLSDAWRCEWLPTDNQAAGEPCTAPMELQPPSTGNTIRLIRYPPDRYLWPADEAEREHSTNQVLEAMGITGVSARGYEGSPMHRTNTLDYTIIISGEIYAVMEQGETLLRPGDVLIQRGTNHAWSNRSDKECLMAMVLNAAKPIERD